MAQPTLSNANQESYVAQGLALAVLYEGVYAITADKLKFEFAFGYAWRRFPHMDRFRRVLATGAADPYHAVIGRSERRRGSLLAAWASHGPNLEPYVWNEGWSIEESGQMLADWSGVPWTDWQTLGRNLLAHLRGETEYQNGSGDGRGAAGHA
ncbi:hypothetical protein [Phytoactinopolyspora halotolerans]|uniref:Uncharacterized protein n=1 Tax=Phytoactinopolyspora halotolerans TaxID=1981512 RepID=A0A6L9S9Z6_9ACTN|nr:hypothetical protein [Phytoactinopolyspora halotolerans]NEE01511.1 hypothetical protein [Phytoactinopolyspora halotolerans]